MRTRWRPWVVAMWLGLVALQGTAMAAPCGCGRFRPPICTSVTERVDRLPYERTWGSCCDGGPWPVRFNQLPFSYRGRPPYKTLPAMVEDAYMRFDGCR